jgi:3-oxoacyl-[acyl-carrier protein] reductase
VGRGIALTLAAAGAAVGVNALDGPRAEAVADEIRAAGGSARALAFDVTDYDGVLAAVASLGEKPDILVNNAGNAGTAPFVLAPFAETGPDDWQRYFGVNLYGTLHCTRAALPHMQASGFGRVITIVSEAARSGEPGLSTYAAAKAAAAGFTRSLAKEVGRHGVTANNIALGSIDRPERHDPGHAEQLDRQLRRYIIRRLGTPDDVAPLVIFLASDHAAWITGQTHPVNGGITVNQ